MKGRILFYQPTAISSITLRHKFKCVWFYGDKNWFWHNWLYSILVKNELNMMWFFVGYLYKKVIFINSFCLDRSDQNLFWVSSYQNEFEKRKLALTHLGRVFAVIKHRTKQLLVLCLNTRFGQQTCVLMKCHCGKIEIS